MAKYLISFPSAAMAVPEGEWEAVSRDSHAVIDAAKAAGVYVFAGGIDEAVPPVLVAIEPSPEGAVGRVFEFVVDIDDTNKRLLCGGHYEDQYVRTTSGASRAAPAGPSSGRDRIRPPENATRASRASVLVD